MQFSTLEAAKTAAAACHCSTETAHSMGTYYMVGHECDAPWVPADQAKAGTPTPTGTKTHMSASTSHADHSDHSGRRLGVEDELVHEFGLGDLDSSDSEGVRRRLMDQDALLAIAGEYAPPANTYFLNT